jgi:hypothetical protein
LTNKRQILVGILLLLGLLLLGVSFVGFGYSSSAANWSPDQAREYQAASSNLHRLSHEYAQKAATGEGQKVRAELSEAQQHYQRLRENLDAAIERPKRLTWFARMAALILIAAGIAAFFYRPV